jgi:predicted glycosyltransferase
VFDPVPAYGMSSIAAQKLAPCGYLRRADVRRPPQAVRQELGIANQPLVLVTVGGGGDGFQVLKSYLDMLAQDSAPSFHSLLVTGPLMADHRRGLLRRAASAPAVTLLEFTPDLLSYMAAADLVVGMAGYNTVCEILSLGKRSVLIPRGHTRAEQRMRASLLAERNLARLLAPEELTPESLRQAIRAALHSPLPTATLNLNGLENISRAISGLLHQEATYRLSARPQRSAATPSLNGARLELAVAQ